MIATKPYQLMKEADPYLAKFERFEKEAKQPPWLFPLRKAGIARFAELGFPTTRHEDWRFTNVAPIAKLPFKPVFQPSRDGLTAESIAVGILAAYTVGTTLLGIDHAYAWHNMLKYTQPQHILMGIIKAVVFAAVLALVSCFKGMNCREGAEGVGRATTEAVVYSSITILVSNFFLTLFLTRLLGA